MCAAWLFVQKLMFAQDISQKLTLALLQQELLWDNALQDAGVMELNTSALTQL